MRAQQTQVVKYVEERMQLVNFVWSIWSRDGDFEMCGEEQSVALDTFALILCGWQMLEVEVGEAGEGALRHVML